MSKAFLIAAPWSNSGKTTITLGLVRHFSNQGYKVQPFKCGPDYIDTIHHTKAARKESINLDTVMMSDEHLQEVFLKHSANADINIIEGVMGLFDGSVKDKGSSAEIAKKLNVPVILIVNAKAMAYTVAPILHGLKTFDPEVQIAGVIFNFVKTESHYAFLKEACETVGLQSFGYIPPNEEIAIPSRHLGLHIDGSFETIIEKAAEHIGKHIDLDLLINNSNGINPITPTTDSNSIHSNGVFNGIFNGISNGINPIDTTIAVAKDEAFTFTYVENLNYLKQLGKIVFFSPIHDEELPEADFIYLAGGYPELYLEQLSANIEMQTAIKNAANTGTKILAECGGMMYLGKSIFNSEGIEYPMANVFDFSTTMENKKLRLGYRRVQFENEELWGHEFHYSKVINDTDKLSKIKVFTARDKEIDTKIYQYKNVLASYIHLYWGAGNFKWLTSLPLASRISNEITNEVADEIANGINPIELEHYFVTFATAKSRISDRMVKYNTSKFIRDLDALIFNKSDIEKMFHLFNEAIKRYEMNVHCFNILPDHIHILLKVQDEKDLNEQIGKLKGFTSFKFQRYKEWEKGEQHVWVQKFNRKKISLTDGSMGRVTNYIRNNHFKHQERWGQEMATFIEKFH
ncbi:cobyrinate a,c-diamide synthase [Tenacibaculum sp.]|nr:cobyrinate a,c-diamide synthase [Tenacibaculum sp.]